MPSLWPLVCREALGGLCGEMYARMNEMLVRGLISSSQCGVQSGVQNPERSVSKCFAVLCTTLIN